MSAALEEKRHRQLSEQRKLRRTEAEHQRQMSAALVRTEAGLNEAERKRVKKSEYNKKYRTLMKQKSENKRNSGVLFSEYQNKPTYYSLPTTRRYGTTKEQLKAESNTRYLKKKPFIRSHGLIRGTSLYEESIVEANMEKYISEQISTKKEYDPRARHCARMFRDSSFQITLSKNPLFQTLDMKWLEIHDKNMMKLSEIDKNRVAGIWKRYLDPPSSIRNWLVEYDMRVLDYSATPLSSNELQQIIVESDMEYYISEQIKVKKKYDNCQTEETREWRERHDKAMRGLSEIEKNRIAEIWKRYLDPPSSIRKCLEEYDKKVHTCSATPLSSNACILCSILDLECQHTHTVYATTTLSKTTAIICTVQPLFNRQCKCQPPMGSKPI